MTVRYRTTQIDGRTVHLDPGQTAWLAGFFEGEGSVYIRRGNHRSGRRYGAELGVNVTNVDRSALEPFEQFGGYIRPVKKVEGCRQAYRWIGTARIAERLLRAICPWVRSDRAKAQVALALEFQDGKGPSGRHQTDADRERDEALRVRLCELNRRGDGEA